MTKSEFLLNCLFLAQDQTQQDAGILILVLGAQGTSALELAYYFLLTFHISMRERAEILALSLTGM